jgi:hypothetical protein
MRISSPTNLNAPADAPTEVFNFAAALPQDYNFVNPKRDSLASMKIPNLRFQGMEGHYSRLV